MPRLQLAGRQFLDAAFRPGHRTEYWTTGGDMTLGVTNKTHGPMTIRIGSTSRPFEFPLDTGERRSFHGYGAELLGDAEVEILDGRKADK